MPLGSIIPSLIPRRPQPSPFQMSRWKHIFKITLFCRTWPNAQLEILPCPASTQIPSIPLPEKFTALLRFSRFNSIMFPGTSRREQKQRNQSLHERQAWTSARTNTPKLWEGCISILIRKARFCQMFTSLFFPALPSEGSRTFPEAQRAFLCKAVSIRIVEDCHPRFCSENVLCVLGQHQQRHWWPETHCPWCHSAHLNHLNFFLSFVDFGVFPLPLRTWLHFQAVELCSVT